LSSVASGQHGGEGGLAVEVDAGQRDLEEHLAAAGLAAGDFGRPVASPRIASAMRVSMERPRPSISSPIRAAGARLEPEQGARGGVGGENLACGRQPRHGDRQGLDDRVGGGARAGGGRRPDPPEKPALRYETAGDRGLAPRAARRFLRTPGGSCDSARSAALATSAPPSSSVRAQGSGSVSQSCVKASSASSRRRPGQSPKDNAAPEAEAAMACPDASSDPVAADSPSHAAVAPIHEALRRQAKPSSAGGVQAPLRRSMSPILRVSDMSRTHPFRLTVA
jgi:hypothetical protein